MLVGLSQALANVAKSVTPKQARWSVPVAISLAASLSQRIEFGWCGWIFCYVECFISMKVVTEKKTVTSDSLCGRQLFMLVPGLPMGQQSKLGFYLGKM